MTTGAPDYYKRILLYGMYEGEAVPLACDEQGRLIFIAEQVSPFDKAGTVLLQEDFSDGLVHVVASTSGAGASVALDDTEALVGGYSCKLTAGSDVGKYARLHMLVTVAEYNKNGVELAFRLGSEIDTLHIRITVQTGAVQLMGYVEYDRDNKKWVIHDYGDDVDVDILTGTNYVVAPHVFYRVKFVIDPGEKTYLRFKHPTGSIDLSAYQLYEVATDANPSVGSWIWVTSHDGDNDWVLIDDIRLTKDES